MPSRSKPRRKSKQRPGIIPPTGGKDMAENYGHSSNESTSYTDQSASWRNDMKKMIANYIDTSEGLAKGTLTFQERATAWAKNTPWAPLFTALRDVAGQWIEGSASLARKLWRIEEEAGEKAEEAGSHFSKGQT